MQPPLLSQARFALLGLPQGRPCTGVPVLAGEDMERLFPGAQAAGSLEHFSLYRCGHYTLGWASIPCTGAPDKPAALLYGELLAAAGAGLCRVWNYIPGINLDGPDGRERYKSFCLGRARAFEDGYGRGFEQRLPAASAVGTDGNELVVMFAANPGRASHFENPLQTPAYEYPNQYGPRPPSFARATLLHHDDGSCDAFISGTASIRGYRTIAPGDTHGQLECTLENLQSLGTHCGLGANPCAGRGTERHLKVYIRHAADLSLVSSYLKKHLLVDQDHVSYLRSDICRADLNIEIELSAFKVRRA